MSRPLLAAILAISPLLPVSAWAEVPRSVADIPPVQALVARVMQGLGEPVLLVRPGASPHGYALKPSEAAALNNAQAVFFVGPELTPWLLRPIETLAPNAAHVELLAAPGTVTLATRTGATFAPHDPAHEDDGHEIGHDHDHDHEGIDPHAWLDPENGKAWLTAIAAELSRLDPDNAATYAANATAGAAEIDAAELETADRIAVLGQQRFVAFHDAYQYLENRFGITTTGAVSLSDASTPSPARIAELRTAISDMGATCALSEPQFNADLLKTVFDGSPVKTVVIDPLGSTIPPGPEFYPALIRSLGEALSACR